MHTFKLGGGGCACLLLQEKCNYLGNHIVGDSACIDSYVENSCQRQRSLSGNGGYDGYHVGGSFTPLKWSLNYSFNVVFWDKPF